MNLKTLAPLIGAGMAMVLSACSSGGQGEASAEQTAEAAPETTQEQATQASGEKEPCFSVGEVGTELSLPWELVVAARDMPDQKNYIDDLADNGEDMFDDVESGELCAGYQEIADFNYELANLNMDIMLGEDSDENYQTIADIGNELIELSDDEGYEWDYEFVTDVGEISP